MKFRHPSEVRLSYNAAVMMLIGSLALMILIALNSCLTAAGIGTLAETARILAESPTFSI